MKTLFKLRSKAIWAALLISLMAISAGPIQAAELIVMEQKGCAWCARWNAEIGPIYPNTAEAKIAPLRIIDINQPLPDDLANIRIERFTPTFVLVEDGVEISRMRGYTGDNFFWFLLDEMLQKLPPRKNISG